MKNKLEVGMYVRFKDKRGIEYIRKIVEIPEDNRYASLYLDKEANYSCGLSPKNIVKASFDITDLIRKGDYVNGCRVYKIGNCLTIILDNDENISWINHNDIKSIVTKEQMEQMSYRIGDE